MKKDRWQLKIIITHDRTITRERPRPPANAGAVRELVALGPRTRKSRAIEAVKCL